MIPEDFPASCQRRGSQREARQAEKHRKSQLAGQVSQQCENQVEVSWAEASGTPVSFWLNNI